MVCIMEIHNIETFSRTHPPSNERGVFQEDGVSYMVLTGEYWRLKQLYEFVNVCQELNSHLKIGTELGLRFCIFLMFSGLFYDNVSILDWLHVSSRMSLRCMYEVRFIFKSFSYINSSLAFI
jgi:hypothetical protein